MKRDAAIDDVREVRHRISERYGHDTEALLRHYKQLEERYASRILRESAAALPDKAGT